MRLPNFVSVRSVVLIVDLEGLPVRILMLEPLCILTQRKVVEDEGKTVDAEWG